jgi:hypothetical protein
MINKVVIVLLRSQLIDEQLNNVMVLWKEGTFPK